MKTAVFFILLEVFLVSMTIGAGNSTTRKTTAQRQLIAKPAACDESTNCRDVCDKENPDILLPHHCFKGTCIDDPPVNCADLGGTCKGGTPDDYCS